MILTGSQIKLAKEKGYLDISDWDDKRLNPNSYNLRLADELMVYAEPEVYGKPHIDLESGCYISERVDLNDPDTYEIRYVCHNLDMKKDLDTYTFTISDKGHVLEPGILYLARTMEYTETHKFVPMLEGRSSVGRLGISIHSTAGFGDIGFCGYWTLEISCVQPVRIYPGVEICQIYYHTIAPDSDIWIPNDDTVMKYNSGKYQKNTGIQPSMMWKEFKK